MENPTINELDKLSLTKDIAERDRIIEEYNFFGVLDRADAIDKIKKLRATDLEIATVTAAELTKGSVPFEQCSNDQIINELILQRNVLNAKLSKKVAEKNQ